eukprot:16056492-Heterocapsa_arctica.AAC.1
MGLLRTHVVDVQRRYSRRLAATSRLMPWLARHVEFIQNRFGIRSAMGLTPFETVNIRPYRGELLPWHSPCM